MLKELNSLLSRPLRDKESLPPLGTALTGEFLGTFVMVFFGTGVIYAAVISGAQVGLWQVAAVWAVAVSIGIYTAAALSGAHINPAITLTVAVYDGFPFARVAPYWAAQLAGAAFAALVLYAMYANAITAFEQANGLVRGEPGSQLSAMVFGEYFPNPAIYGTDEKAWQIVSRGTAFYGEMIGTAMLAFIVSVVTHRKNFARPHSAGAAVAIGVGLAAIISVISPITQAGFNPARDFGPRVIAFFLGWDEIAIPGPRGGFFIVYILAPLIGALIGGGVYRAAAARIRKKQA